MRTLISGRALASSCYSMVEGAKNLMALGVKLEDVCHMGDREATLILEAEMQSLAPFVNAATKIAGNRVVLCGGVMEHHVAELLPILKKYVK